MSELLWVSVPSGRLHDGAPRLRVVVVPRLRESLADAGMADWPTVVANAALSVEVAVGDVVQQIGHRLVGTGRSDAWHAVVDHLEVRPFSAPEAYDAPTVEPTSDHAGHLLSTYQASARAMSVPGPGTDALVAGEIASWDAAEQESAPPSVTSRTAQLPDFHRVVSLLREHPEVLRALGLILDLELVPDPPAGGPLPASPSAGPAMIRVSWPAHPLATRIVPLWTKYEFDGETFLPAGAGDIRGGMLDLTGARASIPGTRTDGSPLWEVVAVDVDGAVARLRGAARALRSQRAAPADGAGVALPALRSGGLALIRRQRADELVPRPPVKVADAQAGAHADASEGLPQLSAADLVLGYRLDVKPQGEDQWRSLMQRKVTYHLGDEDGITITPDGGVEEGHVKPRAMSQEPDPAAGPLAGLRSDEVVTRWSGWSLTAPRPVFDRSITRQPPHRLPGLPFRFGWDPMTPPSGSLPPLRFGTLYRLRVRIANIAGTGLDLADVTGNEQATDLVACQRYEPIASPVIPLPPGMVGPDGTLHPEVLGPGGAADRLVVRSDPAGDGAGFAHLPDNSARSILPPRTTFDVVERWGALDGADDESTWALAARAMKLTITGTPEHESPDAVPDLRDPAAVGVAAFLRDVDGPAGVGQLADQNWDEWPASGDRSVHLVSGPLGTIPNAGWPPDQPGVLVVSLPPAGEAVLELSSFPHRADVGKFAIKDWLGPEQDLVVSRGRHPMVNPAHTLRLVHAVRRPLHKPRGVLGAERGPGETTARLTLPQDLPLLGLDPASTLQLDLSAEWDDVVDDPREAASRAEHQVAALPPLVITRDQTSLPPLQAELGDTRHRLVTFTAAATGRFREFFDDSDDEAFVARNTLGQVPVPSTVRPPAPTVLSAVPGFVWSGQDVPPRWSQTVGTRLVRVRTGSRIHVEVARPWFLTGEGEKLAVAALDDASGSAPPPELQPYTSQVARDPLYDAAGPVPAHPDRWVTAHMLPGPGQPDAVPVPGAPGHGTVSVRGYDVSYADSRCFADIAVQGPADRTYCPLVQLAVARYQPQSLPGCTLSPVIKTGFVPLLPDRELVVERLPQGLQVTLNGLGPAGNVGRNNRVDAHLERLDGTSSEVPVDAVDIAALSADTAGVPAWRRIASSAASGELGSPLAIMPVPGSPERVRLVVKEVERFFADDLGTIVEPVPGGDLTERIVFTDIINLV